MVLVSQRHHMPQTGEDHCNDGKPIKAPTSHLRFPPANFIFLPPQFHRERYCFFVCHGDLLLPQSADWLANHTTQARREPFVLVSRLGDGFPWRITCIFRSSIHFRAAITLSGTPALESLARAYLDTYGFSPPHLQAPTPGKSGPTDRTAGISSHLALHGLWPSYPHQGMRRHPSDRRQIIPLSLGLFGSNQFVRTFQLESRCKKSGESLRSEPDRYQSVVATREWRLPANFQPSSALVTTLHCVAIFQRAFGIGVGSKR